MLKNSLFLPLSLCFSPLLFFLKIFYLVAELEEWPAEREGIPDSWYLGILGKVLVQIQQLSLWSPSEYLKCCKIPYKSLFRIKTGILLLLDLRCCEERGRAALAGSGEFEHKHTRLDEVGFYQNRRQFRFVPGIFGNHAVSPAVVKINTACILDLQVGSTL